MKFYKVRSLTNLEFFVDILFNERLYCAHFADLNDPFEGIYLSGARFPQEVVERIDLERAALEDTSQPIERKEFNRICSLSGSCEDFRLWSYYGDGHRGVAIEIDFTGHEHDLMPIRYTDAPDDLPVEDPKKMSMDELLSVKTTQWEYERESRIVQKEPYYSVKDRITAVYLGARISHERQALLEKLVPQSIPMYATHINIAKLAVEPRELLKRRQKN